MVQPLTACNLLLKSSSGSVEQRRSLHLQGFLFLYLTIFAFLVGPNVLLLREGVNFLPPREKVKSRKTHFMAIRLNHLHKQVAEVVYVLCREHVVTFVLQHTLTNHSVRMVQQ